MVAFGFPPSFEDREKFRGVSDRDIIDAIKDAFDDCGWSWTRTSRWSFEASVSISFFSWGEKLEVEFEESGDVRVKSRSVYPLQWIDWGRNESNVRKFLGALHATASQYRRRRDDDYDDDFDDE